MADDSPFRTGFSRCFKVFVESVKNFGDLDDCYEKLAKWDINKLTNQYIFVAEPMRCGFQILNHGDIWINNMMFKSDDNGNPLDVSMIDYQGPFWAGPGVDLMYFMITSVADDIKIDQFDNLIEFYHVELTKALKKLNYDAYIPTLAEVHTDLLDKGSFGEFGLNYLTAQENKTVFPQRLVI